MSTKGSPFGERKNFRKDFERRVSRSPADRLSRQDSDNKSDAPAEDFRAMARRISKSGASSQLLDPAARLAALKKIEAEEKARLQKEIEDMKNSMNNVETVEKTGFKYDPSKVRSQMEDEFREAEEMVERAPGDIESEKYQEWLEEIMSRGWNEEARSKRSIVRRYSIIVPEVKEEFQLSPEEDELTEEEKMKREVEEAFSEIDLTASIEELSNDTQWMCEIQELVGSWKKVNHHNLSNARKRKIVRRVGEKYPGCSYPLDLEPDEFTEEEMMRRRIEKEISEIQDVLDSSDNINVILDSIALKWTFNLDGLTSEKKKKNKRNVYNYLVKDVLKRAKEELPNYQYPITLEPDELEEAEVKRLQLVEQLEKIVLTTAGKSVESLREEFPEISRVLEENNRAVTGDNVTKQLTKQALALIYGTETTTDLIKEHQCDEEDFQLNDAGLADKYIRERMDSVEEKLNRPGNFPTGFSDEVSRLKAIKAHVNQSNIRLLAQSMAREEARRRYPECGMDLPSPGYELTDEGVEFIRLSSEMAKLDDILRETTDPDHFLKSKDWEEERRYISEAQMKLSPRNVVMVRKDRLYKKYKDRFPEADFVSDIEFEEFTAEEIEQMIAKSAAIKFEKIKEELQKEIEEAKAIVDRTFKRFEIEGGAFEDHLQGKEWADDVSRLRLLEKRINRKNVFEARAKSIIEQFKRRYPEFSFDDYRASVSHSYESDEEDADDTSDGCLTCEIKSKSSFFSDISDDQSIPETVPEIGEDVAEDGVFVEDTPRAETVEPRADTVEPTTEVVETLENTDEPEEETDELQDETAKSQHETAVESQEESVDVHTRTDADQAESIAETNADVFEGNEENPGTEPEDSKTGIVQPDDNQDEGESVTENMAPSEDIIQPLIGNENEGGQTEPPQNPAIVAHKLRPETLDSQGFVFDGSTPGDTEEVYDDLGSATLPSCLRSFSADPMISPYPGHGYVSPHKTFESRLDSRSELASERSALLPSETSDNTQKSPCNGGTALGLGQLGKFIEEHPQSETVHPDILAENLLPCNLKSDSIGSDNVFDPQSSNASRSHSPLVQSKDMRQLLKGRQPPSGSLYCPDLGCGHLRPIRPVLPLCLYSPCAEPDCGSPLKLPSKTTEQHIETISDESDDQKGDQGTPRSTKRKKVASTEQPRHPLIKRQDEYNRRISLLSNREQKKDPGSPVTASPASTKRQIQPPSSLEIKRTQTPTKPAVQTSKPSPVSTYDHIQSAYKQQKPDPTLDRTKYVKVPTLEDNFVTAEPILKGLLPAAFYEQKLSFDLNSDGVQSPVGPRKHRSNSEIALPTAPTTGHLLWSLLKERKLDREDIITDLDTAVRIKRIMMILHADFMEHNSFCSMQLQHPPDILITFNQKLTNL
eukprot:sb/3460980/